MKTIKNLRFNLKIASTEFSNGERLVAFVNKGCAKKYNIDNYSYYKITDNTSGLFSYTRIQIDTTASLEYGDQHICLSPDLKNAFKIELDTQNQMEVTLELITEYDLSPASTALIITDKQSLNADKKKVIKRIVFKPLISGYEFYYKASKFIINRITPTLAGTIPYLTAETVITIQTEAELTSELTIKDIVGCDQLKKKLLEFISIPLNHRRMFEHMGCLPGTGVLLSGPKGSGKTTLVKIIAKTLQISTIHINCGTLISKYAGDSEENVRKLFNRVKDKNPVILILDCMESTCKKTSDNFTQEFDRKLLTQLTESIAELRRIPNSFIIGIADSNVTIDQTLKMNGLLQNQLFLKPPNVDERRIIFEKLLSSKLVKGDINLYQLAEETVGYVMADIVKSINEAGTLSVKNSVELEQSDCRIGQAELIRAISEVTPSCLKEFSLQKTNVRWKDVIGCDEKIEQIKMKLMLPRRYNKLYKQAGFEGMKGLMLYGPPGTGKTLIAKAIANEFKFNFISVRGPELKSKWVGETESALRRVFDMARLTAPTIIFFDEIDSLFGSRDDGSNSGSSHSNSVIGQLLSELDGMKKISDVVVIGTTNRLSAIDKALLRPGRFDLKLEIIPPSGKGLLDLFRYYTRNLIFEDGVSVESLVHLFTTGSLTGAEVSDIARSLFEESLISENPRSITVKICQTVRKKKNDKSFSSKLYN